MANQAIALGIRGPQVPDISRVNQQYGQIMNMMAQQRASERQAAQAAQAMEFAAAEEGRKKQMFGSQMGKASAEAFTAQQESIMKFMGLAYQGIEQARGPEDVALIANFLKQNFPDEVFGRLVDLTIADMPTDPTLFPDWKKQTAFETLETAKKFENDFTQQNLGTSTRIVSTPKYGRGPATVVSGSEAAVNLKPTVVNVDGFGPVIVDPNTGRGFPVAPGDVGGYSPPPVGGGGSRSAVGVTSEGGGAPGLGGRGGNSADVVYGFGKFAQPSKPISSMTIGEVQNFQKNELIPATRGKVGAGPDKGTGAVGTYQIVYETLKDYAPKVLGPNWRNTPFTADVQDRIAKAIYEDNKNGNLKKIWAGLPNNRPGEYSNVPWEEVRGQIAAVESGGGGGRGTAGAAEKPPKTFGQMETQKGFQKTLELFDYNPKTGADSVTPLIMASTSGGLEKIGSEAVGFITGKATSGRVALGQLQTLKDNMTFEKLRGKLGAQISDADVRLVASTMGDIANPDIPANERAAKWRNVVLPILVRGAGMEPVKRAPPPQGPRKTPTTGPKQKRDIKDIFGG